MLGSMRNSFSHRYSILLKCLMNPRMRYSTYPIAVKMQSDIFEASNTDPTAYPMIIMHGLFGSKQNWRGIGKALAAKTQRKIYTVDARNHGDSPHTDVHDSDSMAADIVKFMELNNIPKTCLMGHSMGGRSMMYCALKYPELVDRLIIVDISPITIPRDFYQMNLIFEAMLNINVQADLSMAEGRKIVKEQIKAAVDSMETVEFIMLNLRKNPETGIFYWASNVKVLQESLPKFDHFTSHIEELSPYTGQTTFICGKRSNFVNPDDFPQFQKYFPNASIHWLDAGHLVHFDQPQQFINLVVDFLK